MRGFIFTSIMTLLCFAFFPLTTHAYEYWYDPNNTDNAYEILGGIDDGDLDIYADNNFTINGTTYDFAEQYRDAYSDWYYSIGPLYITESSGGTNKLAFYADDYGEIGAYGWCDWYLNGDKVVGSDGGLTDNYDIARTYLNAHDIEDGTPLSSADVESVATHEIGHAFALHHEDEEVAVMNTSHLSEGWDNVQTDDDQGVTNLYSNN